MAQSGFWDDQETAQQKVGELKSLKVDRQAADRGAGRRSTIWTPCWRWPKKMRRWRRRSSRRSNRSKSNLEQLQLKTLLNGPHDRAGALLTIHARDGGTDANDWAEMLLRMYTQWAQKHDYSVELLDRSDNDEAGINNATIAIRGPMAYGYLKGETGMHRLVRISPFNSEGKRQTSFAAVDVAPEVPDSVEIEIDEKDVRQDTFRASGAGGQHVNKTDSAIRLTHVPTGIVVQCQNERSQHKNRAAAWKMLRARMARVEEEKREAEAGAEVQGQIASRLWLADSQLLPASRSTRQGQPHRLCHGQLSQRDGWQYPGVPGSLPAMACEREC